jgi:ribosomal protein S18 acetylase RimI-like enzyme
MKIRPATPADAIDIAYVHVDTWQNAYRGMIPDGYLDNLSLARRGNYWREVLSNPANPSLINVAEDDTGKVVGFVAGGPPQSEQPGYEGELYAIYVLKEQQGKGIGRQLVQALARELRERGMRSMLLWVLKDNEPSRQFYEALGGQLAGEQELEIGGATLTEVAYGWPDIALLTGQNPSTRTKA